MCPTSYKNLAPDQEAFDRKLIEHSIRQSLKVHEKHEMVSLNSSDGVNISFDQAGEGFQSN